MSKFQFLIVVIVETTEGYRAWGVDYRIKSTEVADLDFEWRDRSHFPPRNRRRWRRLTNGADSSFPRKWFGHSLNKKLEQSNENSEKNKKSCWNIIDVAKNNWFKTGEPHGLTVWNTSRANVARVASFPTAQLRLEAKRRENIRTYETRKCKPTEQSVTAHEIDGDQGAFGRINRQNSVVWVKFRSVI